MSGYDNEAAGNAPPAGEVVFETDHKAIGLRYLWLAMGSVLVGMVLSLLMRVQLVWPDAHLSLVSSLLSRFGGAPEMYTALTLLHGSLMVFFVLTMAPQAGFGNYFLPLQIGAREMAFPRMNLLAFWLTIVSFVGVIASFFNSPGAGLSIWTCSVGVFCLAMLLSSINFVVTAVDLRCKGMTLPRLPLTVWAWLVNAILSMLIFSILLAACVFLLSDRFLGAHFFAPLTMFAGAEGAAGSAATLSLWQRLFWFFAQAEVYVAILPCFGIVSHLLAMFSRKRVYGERAAVLALCGVGVFGFCVWGEHMFSSGLNPWSPVEFSLLASSLGLPAVVLVLSWFGTLWKGRLQLNTAMLFSLGFVALFLTGGGSGVFLARHDVPTATAPGDFVAGHFHLVMGVAATFALLAALFFWFPKMFGRRLNERLGKIHFWVTFAGVYCVFMPMQWLGLTNGAAMAGGLSVAGTSGSGKTLRDVITAATILTAAAQLVFLYNFFWTLLRTEKSGDRSPWLATTLEWSVASPPGPGNFGEGEPVIYRGAYEFAEAGAGEDFAAQNLERAPWQAEERTAPPERAHTKDAPKQQAQ
jgi:cytochrome c oxidase subunit I